MTMWIKVFKGYDSNQSTINAKFEFITSDQKTLLEIMQVFDSTSDQIERILKKSDME